MRRLRLRLVLVAIPVVVIGLWAAHTAVLAYTFAAGEKATATVESCGRGGTTGGRRSSGSCHGEWRTDSGETGRGGIYNLDVREAPGETVQVRIGPLGPYANGWERAWTGPAVSLGHILIVLLAYIAVLRWKRVLHRLRLADSIAAETGALIVTGDEKWVLRIEDGAPEPLRDAALVLGLIRLRATY